MRFGLVSSKAAAKLRDRGEASDTGTGPVGSISSDHINNPEQQRAGAGFGNSEKDFGPAQTGADQINQRINTRQYGYRLEGKRPAPPPRWQARWFDWNSRIPWDTGTGTPPKADDQAGGIPSDSNMVTGQSWLDRNRRGET